MTRATRNNPILSCSHCGDDGHTSGSCPRSGYLTSAPALTCTHCTHLVESDMDHPYNITHRIITCEEHSTTALPPSTTTLPGPANSAAAPVPSTSPSTAAPSPSPSVANSLETGRRMRGVKPEFYKTVYNKVCVLVNNQDRFDFSSRLVTT